MTREEFQKRCDEVFVSQDGDEYYSIEVHEGGIVSISMSEQTEDGNTVIFNYEPDMRDRPEALDYLLGKRNDFSD